MAVVSSKLMTDGRDLEVNEELAFTYGLAYEVRTDDPTDDARDVLDGYLTAGPDPGPNWMAAYIRANGTPDNSSFARRFWCTQPRKDTPTLWHVKVTFTPLPRGADPAYTGGSPIALIPFNPINEPPKYRIETRTVTKRFEEDRDGAPILNSAGQPFDEACEVEKELEVYVFQLRVASAATVRQLNRDYCGKLNDAAFLGYAAEHLLCGPFVSSESEYAGGIRYWTIEVRIYANDKPWREEFVNRGYMHYRKGHLALSSTLAVATDPVLDAEGEVTGRAPCSEPVLLTDGTETDEDDVVYPGAGYRLSEFYPEAMGNTKKIALLETADYSALPFASAIPA